MRVESLNELAKAFAEWRSARSHEKEPAPEKLLARARKAAGVHGMGQVCRATVVDRRRLQAVPSGHTAMREQLAAAPSYSRVELAAPAAGGRPFAEVETGTGLKVRFFAQTPEAVELLTSLCGAGGGR